MRIGVTTKLWNAALKRGMQAKGLTLIGLTRALLKQDPGLMPWATLRQLMDLRTLRFRWHRDPEVRQRQEDVILRVSAAVEIPPEEIYPTWFADMPVVPTVFEVEKDVDRLALVDLVSHRRQLPAPATEAVVEKAQAYGLLRVAMKKALTRREWEVLDLRFGITNGNTLTLDEVGRVVKASRERVRQIEAKGIRKLHAHLTKTAQAELLDVLIPGEPERILEQAKAEAAP